MEGLDLLGADPAPRGVLIRVRNAQALAAKQGGAAGAIAATLVPQTIEGVVLDKMAAKLKEALTQQGVDAEVSVVSAAGARESKPAFGEGAAFGAAGMAALWAAWTLLVRRLVLPAGS
jgi:hypothetical protein